MLWGKEPDRQRAYKNNTETRSRNHWCRGRATGSMYSKCVSLALDIQHALRMLRIAICSLSGSTTFFALSQKRNNFGENALVHKMCVPMFSTTFM